MSTDERSTGVSLPGRLDDLLSRGDELPLAPSFAGGVGAFVGGYVAFVSLLAVSGSPDFGTPLRTLREIGSLYYNAQNVPLVSYREIALGDAAIPQQVSINIIQEFQPSLPRIVYYTVPVIAITVVTGLIAYRYLDRSRPIETGVGIVGGATLGYVLAALVGSLLVAQRVGTGTAFATLTPAKQWTLAYGLAYPLLVSTLVVVVLYGFYHLRGASSGRDDGHT